MNSFKVKLLGITVAELVCSEPEVVVRIDNTGGSFEIDTEEYSPEDDDYEIPPDDPQYGFGFRSGTCLA